MSLTPVQAREILQNARTLWPAQAVHNALLRIAGEITHALREANPLVLCVMRGALVFAGQLLPRLNFPLEVDVLDVTRYRNTTQGGALSFRTLSATPVADRTVLVLDDILDEGVTLAGIRDRLLAAGARRVQTAVFAVKDTGRAKPIAADFYGVKVPNVYVFGFGMDVHGYWRNLPAIYALNEEHNFR